MSKATKKNRRRELYVLDTNVLLYNPRAIFAFPGAEVVIPDQVLVELDRLKTARADKELRYRGREFARILFDISEYGRLTDGIPFGDDSILRVVSYAAHKAPDNLSGKNADDRILSIVYQLQKEQPERLVTIVTNDLNMLVKAQMLDIPVTKSGEEFAYGRVRRTLVWLNSQKKALSLTLTIVALATAIVFSQKILNPTTVDPTTPPKLLEQLKQYEAQERSYQMILDKNPKDLQALIGMGNIYYDRGDIYQDPKYYNKAIEMYKKALEVDPKNANVRLDMALEYTKLNMGDVALKEFDNIIAEQPDYELAYFYSGTLLMERNQVEKALARFEKYIEMAPTGQMAIQATNYINQIKDALKKQ
ncbi:MAG: PIN domain-containing protein [Candidatus Aquicultorales bacterium]